MKKDILKDLIHSASNVTHHIAEGISHVAHDLTQTINDISKSNGEKIENFLKEKGISVIHESRHGNDCHNIISNSDGTFFTNNSIDFSRSLLNQILFSEDGEERLSNAMSGQTSLLKKVQNPQQKVLATKATPLFSNKTSQ